MKSSISAFRCSSRCPKRHDAVRRLLAALIEAGAAADALLDEDGPKDAAAAARWAGICEDVTGFQWGLRVAQSSVEGEHPACCSTAIEIN